VGIKRNNYRNYIHLDEIINGGISSAEGERCSENIRREQKGEERSP